MDATDLVPGTLYTHPDYKTVVLLDTTLYADTRDPGITPAVRDTKNPGVLVAMNYVDSPRTITRAGRDRLRYLALAAGTDFANKSESPRAVKLVNPAHLSEYAPKPVAAPALNYEPTGDVFIDMYEKLTRQFNELRLDAALHEKAARRQDSGRKGTYDSDVPAQTAALMREVADGLEVGGFTGPANRVRYDAERLEVVDAEGRHGAAMYLAGRSTGHIIDNYAPSAQRERLWAHVSAARAKYEMPPVATVGALIARLSALDANTPVAVTNGRFVRVLPSVHDGSVARNDHGNTLVVSSASDSLQSDVWTVHDLPEDATRVVVID